MKNNFRLIISGEFRPVETTNLNELIEMHLMGAAEFEGNNIWTALIRIYKDFPKYKFYNTGIIGKNGVELVVFTKNYLTARKVKRFINKPYELKRPCRLELVQKYDTRLPDGKSSRTYSFWWCIDNSDKMNLDYYSEYGDWMACYKDDAGRLYKALVQFKADTNL